MRVRAYAAVAAGMRLTRDRRLVGMGRRLLTGSLVSSLVLVVGVAGFGAFPASATIQNDASLKQTTISNLRPIHKQALLLAAKQKSNLEQGAALIMSMKFEKLVEQMEELEDLMVELQTSVDFFREDLLFEKPSTGKGRRAKSLLLKACRKLSTGYGGLAKLEGQVAQDFRTINPFSPPSPELFAQRSSQATRNVQSLTEGSKLVDKALRLIGVRSSAQRRALAPWVPAK